VVDVVLGGDVGAGGGEQSAHRVAERGPSGVADVQRAGRVGGDVLEVDRVTDHRLVAAVAGSRLDDGPGELARGGRVEGDVEESGAGDVDVGDAGGGPETFGDDAREIAGPHAGGPRQLHRDVARPVAVGLLLRSLHADLRGHLDGDVARLDGGGEGGADRCRNVFGGHDRSV